MKNACLSLVRPALMALLLAPTAQAQKLQVHLGGDLFIPQGGAADYFEFGAGPSMALQYKLTEHLATSLEFGYARLFMKESGTGTDASTSMIPVQVGTTFFVAEYAKGPYFQVLAGAFNTDFMILSEGASAPIMDGGWRSSLTVGAGFQRSRLDLGLRYVFLFTKAEERSKEMPAWSYVAMHAGYALWSK